MNKRSKEVVSLDRKVVPVGQLRAEYQAFMDVQGDVFGQTGFGYLEWENTTGAGVDYASSYSESSYTSLVRLLPGDFMPRYSHELPNGYELKVLFENKTHTLEVQRVMTKDYHQSRVWLTFDSGGELLAAQSSDHWYDLPYASHSRGVTKKREEEASLQEVGQVLADATTFLLDLQKRPEWKSKPKGPVYGGTDLAVVGG